MDSDKDFAHLQDIIGQLPILNSYAQICLFFESPDKKPIVEKLSDLRAGLTRLSDNFPWLAGHVVTEGRAPGNSGVVRLVRFDAPIPLVVKDLGDGQAMPSMSTMKRAGFPFEMLDASVIASQTAFGQVFKGEDENEGRVLVVNATIVDGGLLLNFAGQHHYMDMNGLGQVIWLYAKACRNESFTATEIEQGNRSRIEVIPLLGEHYRPGPELENLIARPSPVSAAAAAAVVEAATTVTEDKSPSVSWAYFDFSAAALKQLKDQASHQRIVPYVTTNDAISALVWQRVVKARADQRGASFTSTCTRAADGRRALGLSKDYLGHGVMCTYLTEADAPNKPLGDIAGKLRALLDNDRLKHTMQGLVTMLSRSPDKSTIGYGANYNPVTDILISSWASNPCMDSDFGAPLGKPIVARRPRFTNMEGLTYLMPKSGDGSIAVATCLRDDDIAALRRDHEFTSYAKYIG